MPDGETMVVGPSVTISATDHGSGVPEESVIRLAVVPGLSSQAPQQRSRWIPAFGVRWH